MSAHLRTFTFLLKDIPAVVCVVLGSHLLIHLAIRTCAIICASYYVNHLARAAICTVSHDQQVFILQRVQISTMFSLMAMSQSVQ